MYIGYNVFVLLCTMYCSSRNGNHEHRWSCLDFECLLLFVSKNAFIHFMYKLF